MGILGNVEYWCQKQMDIKQVDTKWEQIKNARMIVCLTEYLRANPAATKGKIKKF